MDPVLQVEHLSVQYQHLGRPAAALRDVSFEIRAGQVVGLLGESGAGKSTLAAALLKLLAPTARIVHGSIRFQGRELTQLTESQWEAIRGAGLSLVFQEPALSLSPVMRVGTQIANVIRAHRGWSGARCRDHAEKLMVEVGLGDTKRMYEAYPHELSSGEKQRVAVAQAVACEPGILIADEPTANLDNTTAAQVLELFQDLKAKLGLGILFISHTPMLLAGFADNIMVMYAGQIVEQGPTREVFARPLHPYTAELLRCIPANRGSVSGRKGLSAIPGDPPDLASLPSGCAFEARCRSRLPICANCAPEVTEPAPGRSLRCFNPGVID
ncbi:MAG TPA: ABC transporter ATP-binding protein [Terriglobales bacterium]|nr:ABC transporter ATP-binding protein [Terriglobales bacterium]